MKLHIDKIVKQYEDKIVIDEISIDLKSIQALAIIGTSGSGKSTLLRLIAGLETFESGRLVVNDVSVDETTTKEYRKKVGFVFQDHNLFSHLSIFDNIALVLEKIHGYAKEDFEEDVNKQLDYFGLGEHSHKLPHQISGGQSQRASIVRALAIKPDLILLDEPTSSLDPILTYEVLHGIKQLVEKEKDVILVTHEIGFAKSVADYVIFMDEGKIIEHGAKILDNPKTKTLQVFLDKVLSFN